MKRGIIIGMLLLAGQVWTARAQSRVDQCRSCHEAIGDNVATLFARGIHASKGLTCADCHGGDAHKEDMDAAMNKGAGFIGVPKGDQISERCARCHADSTRMQSLHSALPTDQFASLKESVHGKLAASGNGRIAQCTTCHGAHGIVSVRDRRSPVYPANLPQTCAKCHSNVAYMRVYNPALPVDQLEKYRTSVHGMRNAKGDVRVAECASCHGSHGIRAVKDVNSSVYPTNIPSTCAHCHSDAAYMKPYGIRTDQYSQFASSVHGVALLQKHDLGAPACNSCHGNHGAVPPGVESISNVCGTCHALNEQLFSTSPHKKAFDARHLPECETCHGNHAILAATDQLLGVGPEAVCSRCHTSTENPKGYVAARAMRAQIDSLEDMERRATELVNDAEQKGMEVSEASFKLRDVRQARLESRTAVHAFNEAKFSGVVGKGLKTATVIEAEANDAISEYYFRRWGLGISTLIITILVVALYLYIRRLERKNTT